MVTLEYSKEVGSYFKTPDVPLIKIPYESFADDKALLFKKRGSRSNGP